MGKTIRLIPVVFDDSGRARIELDRPFNVLVDSTLSDSDYSDVNQLMYSDLISYQYPPDYIGDSLAIRKGYIDLENESILSATVQMAIVEYYD